MPKIVFVTGGVVSSLGKGIVASIIGGLLKAQDIKVKIKKLEPYLNIDPGTLSPVEHGEVYVTQDGAETDLDLGNYERLAGVKTQKSDYITSGLIYNKIMQKERGGEYLGKTVMVIPHVIDEFIEEILRNTNDCDVLICEVGGTVGDLESLPIFEVIRKLKQDFPYGDVLLIHVALLIYLSKAQEWKTKPIQHSVRTLLSYGLQPDILLCRMEEKNPTDWKSKIASLCNIKSDYIVEALDAQSVYHAMLNYQRDGVARLVCELLRLKPQQNNGSLKPIEDYVKKLDQHLPKIKIAIVGKYIKCKDAYKSLEEALMHAAVYNNHSLEIDWLDAENLDQEKLSKADGILVPGGFGIRATEGKKQAIRYARKNNIPYLGICFGMQLAIIEAVEEILSGAASSEFGKVEHPVIAKMEEWIQNSEVVKAKLQMGGSMRLGNYTCNIEPNTLVHKIYGADTIAERHRHRYEVNNNYLDYITQAGIKVSGKCNELVEIIERTDCKFFVACQFHPEFNSSIANPNKLFIGFLKAAR